MRCSHKPHGQPGNAGGHRTGRPVPTPLDEVRGWWRYHPLFANLLRVRLQQDQPGALPALHRAAAAWFEARGLVHEAIEHALAANEAAWAARLIERNFDGLLERAEGAMVDRWVAALPAESDSLPPPPAPGAGCVGDPERAPGRS